MYIDLLNDAILNRNLTGMILYLSKVQDLNNPDCRDRLPLSLAASMESGNDISYPEVIGLLVASGALVSAVNKEGKTAIMHAAENNRLDNLMRLIRLGSDIHAKDLQGKRVLRYAVSKGKFDCAFELMEHGAA